MSQGLERVHDERKLLLSVNGIRHFVRTYQKTFIVAASKLNFRTYLDLKTEKTFVFSCFFSFSIQDTQGVLKTHFTVRQAELV